MTKTAHQLRRLKRLMEESERAAARMRGFAKLETDNNRRAGFITAARSYEANARVWRKERGDA